jgi:hypothetical protein
MPTGGFMNMSNLNIGFMKHEKFSGPHYSPASSNISPTLSYLSSPEIAPMTLLGDRFGNKPSLDTSSMYPDPPGNGPPSYRRSESVSSSNLEENITDTGITIDQIATFISGPDPSDGRWLCLYPDCKKRFGRKENVTARSVLSASTISNDTPKFIAELSPIHANVETASLDTMLSPATDSAACVLVPLKESSKRVSNVEGHARTVQTMRIG